jgi:hypothetical protein
VGADEHAAAFADVAADDDGVDVGGRGAHHQCCDRVAEAVEMRGPQVDDRDIRLLSRRQAADLVVEVPRTRTAERGDPQHVPLVQVPRTAPPRRD